MNKTVLAFLCALIFVSSAATATEENNEPCPWWLSYWCWGGGGSGSGGPPFPICYDGDRRIILENTSPTCSQQTEQVCQANRWVTTLIIVTCE